MFEYFVMLALDLKFIFSSCRLNARYYGPLGVFPNEVYGSVLDPQKVGVVIEIVQVALGEKLVYMEKRNSVILRYSHFHSLIALNFHFV